MSDTQTTSVGLYNSDASIAEQRNALKNGAVPVSVTGLGKMGLPLAAVYADVTSNVTGVDIDRAVVDQITEGECHITGEPGLPELVSELVAAGKLTATTDGTAAATNARVHVAIVPTLIDENDQPDLSVMETAMRTIAGGLEPGDIVIAESTLPPRSCVDRLLPVLEAESGLSLGEFGMAFCPERTASGRALEDIRGAYPKIVGGLDAESTRVAELIYGEINDNEIVSVSDATTAEAVKVFEGVYRDVNIGLANELARLTEEFDIDVTEAIDAANTQPFCEIHQPGAGVGGHCIPYYPRFVMGTVESETPVMEQARETNEEMPHYTATHALDGLRAEGIDPEDAEVLVLGLTYRPGVNEIRATPALPIVEKLDDAGTAVTAVDPVNSHTEPFEVAGATIVSIAEIGEDYDAVVLVTPQPAFDDLDVPALGPTETDQRLVLVDGRQELKSLRGHDAIHYRGIGINV
ncbi:nucleotide sugar dehydrogenase [Halocatena salina]|uniref:UDP-N-acetyl-D-mannosamine dehydrogenase n=1 Tax=Halocatena salina TaxID=2934340 RepID=A0A8U0A2G6_9EURY|nr:nucleotide sugar dehydrogenase [Halocatena salina]UPM43340.1 nucleotide sugar dehydrogenase [Halocatena salina]